MDEGLSEAEMKNESVKSYTTKVLTESSLSALSDILSTVGTPRKLFKTFVFLFCLTGFSYQCLTFLRHVLEYPTIVDIDIQQLKVIELPGFTFCNNNGISRSKFCDVYQHRCTLATEEFCLKYPKRCSSNETFVPKVEYYPMVNNLTMEEFLKVGADLDSFFLEWTNDGVIQNSTVLGPFLRSKNVQGEGRMGCYSIHSLIDSPDHPIQVKPDGITMKPVTTFKFDVEEDDEFIPSRRSGMIFSIHSPYMAVNPTEKGIFMEPGKTYKIYFKMDQEVLLPYPFETDCLNYTEQWLERNKTGPRMQEMCQHKCILEATGKYWNCSFLSIVYPHSLRACEDVTEPYQVEENMAEDYKTCVKNCKDDCSKIKYSRTVQEGFTSDLLWEGHQGEDKKLIIVEIYLEDFEVIVFRHRPQYLFVEVFSSIGGFIGVWLGISLVELTNLFESLFRIFLYSFSRRNAAK